MDSVKKLNKIANANLIIAVIFFFTIVIYFVTGIYFKLEFNCNDIVKYLLGIGYVLYVVSSIASFVLFSVIKYGMKDKARYIKRKWFVALFMMVLSVISFLIVWLNACYYSGS